MKTRNIIHYMGRDYTVVGGRVSDGKDTKFLQAVMSLFDVPSVVPRRDALLAEYVSEWLGVAF